MGMGIETIRHGGIMNLGGKIALGCWWWCAVSG